MDNKHRVDRDEILWRRIHRDHFVEGRITTAAFKDPKMSVDVARLRGNMRLTLANGVGIASFSSTDAYENAQEVIFGPLADNPAHALVIGSKPRSVARNLRDSSTYKPRELIE